MSAFLKISDKYTRSEKRKAYEDFWKSMMPRVGHVVVLSFAKGQHSMRNPTRSAIQERVDLCKEIVDLMRQQFKWSKRRIIDTLPLALSSKLSGLHIDLEHLSRRGSWW